MLSERRGGNVYEVRLRPGEVIKKLCPGNSFHSIYGAKTVSYDGQAKATILEGYVKVTSADVEAVLKNSGEAGVFITRLAANWPRKDPVEWHQQLQVEADWDYVARVRCHAKQQACPMAFRKGGGASLGVPYKDGVVPPKPYVWRVNGVPKTWTDEDLTQCLKGADWKDVEILHPPRGRMPWLIRAQHAEADVAGPSGVYAGERLILLSRPGGRAPANAATLPAPKKGKGKGRLDRSTSASNRTRKKRSSSSQSNSSHRQRRQLSRLCRRVSEVRRQLATMEEMGVERD